MELTLAGVGAVLAGLAGVISAWHGFRKAKEEGADHCHEQLTAARAESEGYAAQLHRIRMTHPELVDND